MKCLQRYAWIKLPRTQIPTGRSILSSFIRLYASAAYRPGQARYCQYINDVRYGEWVGGIVGLKSILDVSSRDQAFHILQSLANRGMLEYDYNPKSKRLSYRILQTQQVVVPPKELLSMQENKDFSVYPVPLLSL